MEGTLVSFIYPSKNIGWRRFIQVYLPSTYDEKRRFSVIYMFDGINLFDGSHSLSHDSWEADKAVEKFIQKEKKEGFIIVGINTSKNRLLEYAPCYYKEKFINLPHDDSHKPMADKTLNYFLEVKKVVDSEFLTNGINYIAGSSCGGIVSLYFLMKKPDVYRGAGIFSPATGLLVDDFHLELEKAIFPDHLKAFIYMGSKEKMGNNDEENVKEADYLSNALKSKNIMVKESIKDGAVHTEKSWAEAFNDFLSFL